MLVEDDIVCAILVHLAQ